MAYASAFGTDCRSTLSAATKVHSLKMPDSRNAVVSQEYFDELCLENADVFDLSPSAAVEESLQQLQLAAQENSERNSLEHLTLTFPTSKEGLKERSVRREFSEAIRRIGKGGEDDEPATIDNLATVRTNLPALLGLFIADGGFEALLEVFVREDRGEDDIVELTTIETLLEATTKDGPKKEAKQTFQCAVAATPLFAKAWVRRFATSVDSPSSTRRLLLRLAHRACHQCETNKTVFMKQESFVALVTESLQENVLQAEQDHVVLAAVCQLVTVLCTFDDVSSQTSSAHANGRRFQTIVPMLEQVLRNRDDNKELTLAVLACLRALATNDEIVKLMVSVGIVDRVKYAIAKAVVDDDATLLTVGIGLIRNVCAQDDIKCRLCKQEFVGTLVQSMLKYGTVAQLQEHGCGTIAAMALRCPQNAQLLVQCEAHEAVIRAMQRHADRYLVQRQGALALRNLVSRSPELQSLLLQAGAQETLYQTAAKHGQCQDEVYAALRDLGISAKLVSVNGDDTFGQSFGERASNFRAVYD